MRALKLLVIVMGVAIVVGVVVLVAVMAARLSGRGGPATAGGFGRTQVELPAGATIAEMQGAGDRLVLRLVVAGGPQQLLVIDTGSGKALGTIELRPQP